MKLIILDRDGVINYESEEYIKSPDEWRPIPGSLEAISRLHHANYKIAIATNQSGIARGLYDEKTLNRIHQKLHDALANYDANIDAIFYCPHLPEEGCDCRKPEPGLLHQIASYFNYPLNNTPFIGDSYRDIQAGLKANCKPIMVKTGNGTKTLAEHPEIGEQIEVFPDLYMAVDALLNM